MRRATVLVVLLALVLAGCSAGQGEKDDAVVAVYPEDVAEEVSEAEAPEGPDAEELLVQLDLVTDFRDEFDHGPKGAEHQRYIVLHDTEGEGNPESVVSW